MEHILGDLLAWRGLTLVPCVRLVHRLLVVLTRRVFVLVGRLGGPVRSEGLIVERVLSLLLRDKLHDGVRT